MAGAFDNPMVKNQVSKLSVADQLALVDMLQHQTTLEVIKVSQMEEDYSQEKRGSWWAKVKEKFVRV
jgi:hypothetical protein